MRGVDRRPVCGRLDWRSKYRNTRIQENIKMGRQGDRKAERQKGRQKVRKTEIERTEDKQT